MASHWVRGCIVHGELNENASYAHTLVAFLLKNTAHCSWLNCDYSLLPCHNLISWIPACISLELKEEKFHFLLHSGQHTVFLQHVTQLQSGGPTTAPHPTPPRHSPAIAQLQSCFLPTGLQAYAHVLLNRVSSSLRMRGNALLHFGCIFLV